MVTVDPSQTIAQIVRDREETRTVFLQHHVDLARDTRFSLADLCAERSIDQATLLRELQDAIDESEAFDLGGFEWDVHARIVRLSPNLGRMLGLTQLSGAPQTILDRVHPDDRARVGKLFRRAAAHPHAFSFEYRVVRPDGSTRLFATRVEPLEDRSPSFVGTSWDITEQHGRYTAGETSTSALQSALEATVDGILVVDRTGHTATFNERFLALWRIPRDVAVKGTDEAMLDFVLDQLEEPTAFRANVEMLYSNPERESFDVLHFKDGRVYERYSRPQRAKFAIIGRVWSFRDVTERERLLARQTFLVDASELLGSLDVESALDGVTRAAVPYLGDACAIDSIANGQAHLIASHSLDARRFAPTLPADVYAGRSVLADLGGTSTLAAPLRAQDGVIGAIMVAAPERRRHTRADLELVEELARRIALAMENARLLHEARHATRAREEFLSVAAHEVRGPLASLHLAVQMLQRLGVEDATRTEVLELVAREDRRLAKLVEELIDVTDIRAQGLRFEDADVDLSSVVRDVASTMALEFGRSTSTLTVDAPKAVFGRWDRFRLGQLVGHLLSNALKFGLGNPIEMAVTARDGHAILTVRDHGLGVSAAQRESIFRPFERAVPPRHYGGLGLGLYIAQTIAVRYEGTIHVDAPEGGGSLFVVRLPRARLT